MRSNWNFRSLRDCIVHKKGYAFKSKDYDTSGIPIVKVTNLTNDSIDMSNVVYVNKNIAELNSSVALKKDDIIITTVGSWATNPASVVGKVIKVPIQSKGSLLNQNAVIIRPKNETINKKFLFFLLKHQSFSKYLVSNAQGSANQASITLNDIFNYETYIPPLTIQKKIAHILSTLDDKIELNHKMNQTLEEMAQTLFKSWFVDFDPVHAKANSKKSNEVVACELGISEEVLKLFPSSFVESELGLIPEGWEVKRLDEIITVNPKYTLKKGTIAKYVELRMLSTTLMSVNKCIDREFKGSGSRFKNDDTIFVRITPSLENGKRGFVDFLEDDEVAWGSTEYMILRGKSSNLREWVYTFSISDNFRNFAIVNMNGSSGRQRVPKEVIESLLIVAPPSDILNIFSKQTKEIFNKIKLNSQEIQTLQQIRDLLLPKLLSGELDVSNIKMEQK